jgi:hypothetical protein
VQLWKVTGLSKIVTGARGAQSPELRQTAKDSSLAGDLAAQARRALVSMHAIEWFRFMQSAKNVSEERKALLVAGAGAGFGQIPEPP